MLSAATDPQVSRYYEDALSRFDKKDFPGAVIQLKNALKVEQNNLPVQLLLGKVLLANGDLIAAEVSLTEAARLGVNRGEVVLHLARAFVSQGKQQALLDDQRFIPTGLPPGVQAPLMLMRAGAAADLGDSRTALRLIEEARAVDTSSADSWLSEVPVRIRARQLREAQVAAEKAILLAPVSPEALYVRGTVAHVLGDRAAALAWYDKALKIQPNHVEALVSRAGMYIDVDRLIDAQRDVKFLLEASKTEPRGWYLKALIAEKQGDAATARSALNDVTALLDPVPPEFLRYRPQFLMLGGLSHFGLKQFEKAKPYLESVVRVQPASPVSKVLAQIHLMDKNFDRATESLEIYLRSHPNDPQAVLLLASVHMSQGRYARAAQLSQEALKLQDSPALHTMLGMSLMGTGKFSNAVSELEAAIKRDPGQLQAGTALVTIYMRSGQSAKASRLAETLVTQQPANPGLHNLLGLSRMASGNTSGARAAFEQATKLDGQFAAPQINLARIDADGQALDQAVARLNAVLSREPKNVEALVELGRFAERSGRAAEAQRWFEKGDDLAGPNNVQPALALVEFHLRNRQDDLARQATVRLISKAPEAIPVLMMLARVAMANNDMPAARSALSRAANLASFDAPTLVRIATIQLQADHPAGAAHSLQKALAERNDFLPALAVMADVELRQGDLAKAEARGRQIIAKHPKISVGYSILGDVGSARGQPSLAIEQYRKAYQVEPTSDNVLRLLRALTATNAPSASSLAEQWLKEHPNDLGVRRASADSYARAGNLAAARANYEVLVKQAPDDAEALNNLANVLILARDSSALRIAELAMAKKPGAPHIVGTAGWAAFKSGQTERAVQLLRDARLRDPNNPDTRYFLGAVLASAGRNAEARVELESALKAGLSFATSKDAEELMRTLK